MTTSHTGAAANPESARTIGTSATAIIAESPMRTRAAPGSGRSIIPTIVAAKIAATLQPAGSIEDGRGRRWAIRT